MKHASNIQSLTADAILASKWDLELRTTHSSLKSLPTFWQELVAPVPCFCSKDYGFLLVNRSKYVLLKKKLFRLKRIVLPNLLAAFEMKHNLLY